MTAPAQPEWIVLPDPMAVAQAAAERIVQAAQHAIAARGRFWLALAGGGTPKAAYAALAELRPDVSGWIVCLGDERLVPADHADSNFRMAMAAGLSQLGLGDAQVVRVPTELGEPTAVANAYAAALERLGPQTLDLALLGMGQDGHTASLFPGSTADGESERLVAATWVASQSAWRITLTRPALEAAREVLFLVVGSDKAARVAGIRDGTDVRSPAARIRPRDGRVTWLIDAEAAEG